MKRWKIVLPTLLATSGLPLVGLVGCGNPEVKPLRFVGIKDHDLIITTIGVPGSYGPIQIIYNDGTKDINVTSESTVTFSASKEAELSWDNGYIHWLAHATGTNNFWMTATYLDKTVTIGPIDLNVNPPK